MDKEVFFREDLNTYGKLAQYGIGYCAGQVELTSECEQRCRYCFSWREHHNGTVNGSLSLSMIKDLVAQLNAMTTFSHLTFTGGEPVLWKDSTNPEIDFEQLLRLLKVQGMNFSLQVNTALVRPLNSTVWNNCLDRVRVSLDGITPETYKKMRGVDQDPEEIIQRMEELAHPGLSIMICAAKENIDEVPLIIARLNKMKHLPRKIMCLAVLGVDSAPEFWEKYNRLKDVPSLHIPTSFQENVSEVRRFCNSPEAEEIPCAVAKISFHIKATGRIHECCLCTGSEAIQSHPESSLGNVYKETLVEIQKRHIPIKHYQKGSLCSASCQFKQLYINRLAHEAGKITLTMP